jgi:hypothetical protein
MPQSCDCRIYLLTYSSELFDRSFLVTTFDEPATELGL